MTERPRGFRHYFASGIIEAGCHEVIVSREHDQGQVEQWIGDCLKGQWSVDWMHDEDRSATAHERGTIRFVFEQIEDAALARTFWG